MIQFSKAFRMGKYEQCFKFTRIIFGLVFLVISSYWSYQAYDKLKTRPISTKVEFKYGDDGKGDMIDPFLFTFVNSGELLCGLAG